MGLPLRLVKGYDVSPHIKSLQSDGIEFIRGDFCSSAEYVDLVTLFDVFEHIPDPVEFMKRVAQRCDLMGLHIPLDYSFNAAARNLFRSKLEDPGHLLFMDSAWALNILALSGLRVIDYEYTFAFLAPSRHSTLASKLIGPVRLLISKISPWLLAKTLGGASIVAVAATPRGLQKLDL